MQRSVQAQKTPPKDLFVAPKAQDEWSAAILRVAQSTPPKVEIQGLSPEGKMYLEADRDPELRQANMLLNNDRTEEAIPLLQKIAEKDTDNVFLKFAASSKLCSIYERMGNKELFEKEFRRLLDIISKLPDGTLAKTTEQGLRAMAEASSFISNVKTNPEARAVLERFIRERGLAGKVTPEALIEGMDSTMGKMPGIQVFKK